MEDPLPTGIVDDIDTNVTDPNALAVENVEDDIRILGIPLCPIAEMDQGFARLEMTPNGEVYVRYQIALYYAGASGEETLDALISGDFSRDFWRPVADRPNLLHAVEGG